MTTLAFRGISQRSQGEKQLKVRIAYGYPNVTTGSVKLSEIKPAGLIVRLANQRWLHESMDIDSCVEEWLAGSEANGE